MPVVGFLGSGALTDRMTAFRQGLKEAGFVEDQNVAIEYRWDEGQTDRLPLLVQDLSNRLTVLAANSPIVQLCGTRTENCPPGMKTGDQISPPGGYVGGGLQMQTDLAIGPAGDVWVMNNWQDIDSCFGVPSEVISTRCGGQGVTIFFGMAKPVRAPQIGPARKYD
jgi:hypothetical protein